MPVKLVKSLCKESWSDVGSMVLAILILDVDLQPERDQ